jgi:hypothetical protein
MPYVIQDMATEKYLKHRGVDSVEHPFRDVDAMDQAELYVHFDHACHAAFWYADRKRNWRIVDDESGRSFIHDRGVDFKPERDPEDEDDEEIAFTPKFRWKDRLGCVEAIASECVDNGGKYDRALRAIRLADYAFNVKKMPVKQRTLLKRDVVKRMKDIQYIRDSADIGDVVRVPKFVPIPLLGGYKRDGRKLVDAIITNKQRVASGFRYTVQRVQDGQTQTGNGHMIKAIVRRRSAATR